MFSIILHITSFQDWTQATVNGVYHSPTLESEGFIHCSTPAQVINVANALYHAQRGLMLLCIDSTQVQPEIRYEGIEGKEQYPHIYGPLNLDAVVDAVSFEPGEGGSFSLPKRVTELIKKV